MKNTRRRSQRPSRVPDKLFIGLLVCLSLGQQEKPAAEDALIIKARAFLDALNRGDFQAAAADFDETMMKVSGPESVTAQAG